MDFCHKYDFETSGLESLAYFIVKLQSQKQSPVYQQQARHAIFYNFISFFCPLIVLHSKKQRPQSLSSKTPVQKTSRLYINSRPGMLSHFINVQTRPKKVLVLTGS